MVDKSIRFCRNKSQVASISDNCLKFQCLHIKIYSIQESLGSPCLTSLRTFTIDIDIHVIIDNIIKNSTVIKYCDVFLKNKINFDKINYVSVCWMNSPNLYINHRNKTFQGYHQLYLLEHREVVQ